MKHFTVSDIQSWDRFYRGNFINSLSGFKSTTLIGSINSKLLPNLAIFSNIVHIGADPALIGFINRPKSAAPHTIQNIEAMGWYTMNHIHLNIVEQAHQTSAKYEVHINEFDATGLTMEYKQNIPVPFVEQSQIQYAMQLEEIIPIQQNDTYLVIGSVKDVFIKNETIIQNDGFLCIDQAGSMCSLGIDAYFECKLTNRYDYAKPKQTIQSL